MEEQKMKRRNALMRIAAMSGGLVFFANCPNFLKRNTYAKYCNGCNQDQVKYGSTYCNYTNYTDYCGPLKG
jgi:hypothetical protein